MTSITKFGQKNCHLESDDASSVFYSYNTPVAVVKNGHVYVTEQKHSVTTSRHINMFLREMRDLTVEYVTQDEIGSMASGIA